MTKPSSFPPEWTQSLPGVWRAIVGDAEPFTLLGASGSTPNTDAIANLPQAAFPLDVADISAVRRQGKTYLRFPLAENESIYGLGLDFKGLHRNQTVQHLHIDAWEGETGRNHAPVPLYVSSNGYAVLINSARYVDFYIGTATRVDAKRPPAVYDRNLQADKWEAIPPSDTIEVYVPADGVEVIVFAGPTAMDAVRRYNLYCGGGCLPPKWGLGFMSRVNTLATDVDVLEEIYSFAEHGFPLSMLGLEPGWHSHSYPCSFEWDESRFPEPGKFAESVDKKGVTLNLWLNPYVKSDTPLYEALIEHAGSHLVWNGIVPDYSLPEAREKFAAHLADRLLALGPGIGGIKIDEVDGGDYFLWPDTAVFPSGLDAEQLRQTYGLLLGRLTFELYRSADRRTYGLARGTNAGSPPLPYVLYSDSYDFAQYLTAVCNSGFCGVLWAPEVRWANTDDEWARRFQMVAFSPLAILNGYANDGRPWSYPAATEAVRDALLLRQRLMPYLYTTFAQYHFHGTPPVRPMQLLEGFAGPREPDARGEFHDTVNPYQQSINRAVRDQYMLGDSLLVAPLKPGATHRIVALPQGKWYDFYTGAFVGEGGTIEVECPIERTPLFVPDGALIPMINACLRLPKPGETPELTVRHYGERDGDMLFYDDDGVSFAYERGEYAWTRLATTHAGGGVVGGDLPGYGTVSWEFMTTFE